MRCLSCDKRLNQQECIRKYASSGTFVDLCNGCFKHIAEDIADIDSTTDIELPDEEDLVEEDYRQWNPNA